LRTDRTIEAVTSRRWYMRVSASTRANTAFKSDKVFLQVGWRMTTERPHFRRSVPPQGNIIGGYGDGAMVLTMIAPPTRQWFLNELFGWRARLPSIRVGTDTGEWLNSQE
jgi:hypothetical protein